MESSKNKKSLDELNKDFKEFEEVKNKFLEKYNDIIAGVFVKKVRYKKADYTVIDVVLDGEAKAEIYK
jgi:hypothetical protein